MRFPFPTSRLLVACCLLLPLAFALGCGDEEPSLPAETDPGWSDPAVERATGSPDGERGALRTAETLLGHLLARVEAGAGPGTDPRFGQDVEAVAAVLWAPDGSADERRAAQVHVQLTHIVGDVARALKADPKAPIDDTERKIHAAWLAAAAGAPDDYRAWCGNEGGALLKAREEALRAELFR